MIEMESVNLPILNASSEEGFSNDAAKISVCKRYSIAYKNVDLLFTLKQIEAISLIAKGFSNSKIAKKCNVREATIKLMVYRLMKYLEDAINEKVDRFYLIILSQEIIKAGAETYRNLDDESLS